MLCDKVESLTKEQSNCMLWFEMRYGRITASKLYEAAHCKTDSGSLVQQIIGVSKKYDNIFMSRGRILEDLVIKAVEKKLKKKIKKSGFKLISNYQRLGASPDGQDDSFVNEVKTVKEYLKNEQITDKLKAQIMLQMFACNKQSGYF